MAREGSRSCCSGRAILISCFSVTGVVFLVGGLIFRLNAGGIFTYAERWGVRKDMQLKHGSLVFKEWTKPSTPMYMKYFVFHVTNPDEVMKGASPNVTQMGPYSYREIRSNEVLNWTSDHNIVTFMPNRSYIFDPETSCAGCDDRNDSFVTVNIPLLAVSLWLRNTDYKKVHFLCWAALQAEATIKYEVKLFQRKTVYEILWGYTDHFLEFLANPLLPCPGQKGLSSFVQLQYNNTYYGVSAMNTGQEDIERLEQYAMWRGKTHLTWWSDKYANMINGTDGTQFTPGVFKDVTYYAFSPEICRSVFFKYESTVTIKDIELYRFTAPKELYLSGDIYPPNKGFCVPPHCLPSGCLNVSLCQPQNPPIVISPPHFYQGDESLVKAVIGLHPNKREHETFVDIEPITGVVMHAAKRVQINVALESVDTLKETTGKFKKVILPVMYASETGLITDAKAAEFRKKVHPLIAVSHIVEYVVISLGVLCIVAAVVLFLTASSKKRGRLELKTQVDDDEEVKPLVDEKNKRNKVYT